jgi:hypothetical protein
MIFNIEYQNQNLRIEADSAVQAILKIIDINIDFKNNIEFKIIESN